MTRPPRPQKISDAALAEALAVDRERARALVDVSRETFLKLDRLVALLVEWQSRHNLIASSTLPQIWTRHVADSLQLLDLAPHAKVWADLGSGAGFPGIVIACALADAEGAKVHLVESIGKKATFLREAAQVTSAPATIHAMRIEDFVDKAPESIDVVTARALAPLPKLLTLAYPLLKKGALGLFPKGQDVASELTEAAKYWKIEHSLIRSRTDEKAQTLVVRHLESVRAVRPRNPQSKGHRRP
ncbi:MAG TPA: 16S rRNA (guanine(527)-N(7))-methyltransferase RsmG [Sporolactobacillaceae bacterium]|nr:16S rRNA (guanine(527)-N(7))-methyltransferase RsmG [Sporolactobacillaceae bacterium]